MVLGITVAAGLLLTNGGLLIGRRLRYMGWANCPESQAAVQSGCVYLSADHPQPYTAFVLYSYEVAAQGYYGTCTKAFATAREALHFIESCGARQLIARYKPEAPAESYLFGLLDDAEVERQVDLNAEPSISN
jgi:hypothetical protein